jgi:hypothetical protein
MGGAGAAVRWTVMGAPPVEATDLARPRLQELLDVGGQGFESTACEDNVPRGHGSSRRLRSRTSTW